MLSVATCLMLGVLAVCASGGTFMSWGTGKALCIGGGSSSTTPVAALWTLAPETGGSVDFLAHGHDRESNCAWKNGGTAVYACSSDTRGLFEETERLHIDEAFPIGSYVRVVQTAQETYLLAGNGRLYKDSTDRLIELIFPSAATFLVDVSVGSNIGCARTSTDTYCWGHGPVGNGDTRNADTPVLVGGGTASCPRTAPHTQLAAGDNFVLAVDSSRHIQAWGNNQYGLAGQPPALDYVLCPTLVSWALEVEPFDGIIAVAAGQRHALALAGKGGVYAWGYGGDGSLGRSSLSSVSAPRLISLPFAAGQISAGSRHSVVVSDTGTELRMMGGGSTGIKTVTGAPMANTRVAMISAGSTFTSFIQETTCPVVSANRNDVPYTCTNGTNPGSICNCSTGGNSTQCVGARWQPPQLQCNPPSTSPTTTPLPSATTSATTAPSASPTISPGSALVRVVLHTKAQLNDLRSLFPTLAAPALGISAGQVSVASASPVRTADEHARAKPCFNDPAFSLDTSFSGSPTTTPDTIINALVQLVIEGAEAVTALSPPGLCIESVARLNSLNTGDVKVNAGAPASTTPSPTGTPLSVGVAVNTPGESISDKIISEIAGGVAGAVVATVTGIVIAAILKWKRCARVKARCCPKSCQDEDKDANGVHALPYAHGTQASGPYAGYSTMETVGPGSTYTRSADSQETDRLTGTDSCSLYTDNGSHRTDSTMSADTVPQSALGTRSTRSSTRSESQDWDSYCSETDDDGRHLLGGK